jgi:hypothetical protein
LLQRPGVPGPGRVAWLIPLFDCAFDDGAPAIFDRFVKPQNVPCLASTPSHAECHFINLS